ncbi:OLC1v1036216C1 [Oldenlandia corymbosa var. corymbosa]|uniref:OLC1v1036216C1 n=1 Tax=Oldenlandia corymbosa var. corymbosa TaxID=529605 RepID=A0AAV1CUS6_OLDCO|nr:OLC1v1036216C1 [Oldenlandia corymbosa var. corymbosa]
MASSDNLVTMEPSWAFRPTFADSWLTEAFARDTETLTRALQKSLSNHSDNLSSEMINPFYPPETTTAAVHTPTVSGGSTENETAASKRKNGLGGVNGGKITKRKSRASKRSTTTFITADPANFRQMVQQVTGVRFGGNGGHLLPATLTTVLKPEPHRPVNRIQSGCLPTLDTSAFLLDPSNQQPQGHRSLVAPPQATATPPATVVLPEGGSVGFDFQSLCSFPTLESWN